MTPLNLQIERVRRRLWLVLAITALAVVAALASIAGQTTTYTGKAIMFVGVQSDRLSAEDRAVYTRSYIERLNDPAEMAALMRQAKVPSGVSFEARQVALAPTIELRGTSENRTLAEESPGKVADVFALKEKRTISDAIAESRRDDVQEALRLGREIRALRTRLAPLSESDPQRAAIEGELAEKDLLARSLREALRDLPADNPNLVLVGTRNAGVSENTSSSFRKLLLSLLGGLTLGTALALVLGSLDQRLSTPEEVRERLGLETLASVHAGRSSTARRLREQDLKNLANVVALSGLPQPASIAVTGVGEESGEGTPSISLGLADSRALQGARAVVMNADLHDRSAAAASGIGVADHLAAPDEHPVSALTAKASAGGARVIQAGRASGDPYALFARDRFDALVDDLTMDADLVVVAAPPILDAAEAQVMCAIATGTIVVFERGLTRADEAAKACHLIEQVGGRVIGAVIYGAEAPSQGGSLLSRLRSGGGRGTEARAPATRGAERPDGQVPVSE